MGSGRNGQRVITFVIHTMARGAWASFIRHDLFCSVLGFGVVAIQLQVQLRAKAPSVWAATLQGWRKKHLFSPFQDARVERDGEVMGAGCTGCRAH